jgi:uncharacterized protein (DUF1015 family)
MADIRPFRAFRYSDEQLKSLKNLVCPPYDIIPPDMQAALYKKHPLNFIRVEHRRGDPRSKYAEAAAAWKSWREKGVLVRDGAPAFYVYQASFKSQADGRMLSRIGFFASLKVVPWGRGVFPHEKTLPKAKADRFKLFKALRSQTSPIQVLFEDGGSRGRTILLRATRGKPWISFRDEAGVTHRLWRATDRETVETLRSILRRSPVVIADGHHRYETARAYGTWARGRGLGPAAGRVMALFNPSGDPALEILPTHRAVSREKRQFVNLERWGRLVPVAGLKALKRLMSGEKGSSPTEVGLYWKGHYYLYRFASIPPALRGTQRAKLAVAVLHAGALDGLGKEDFFFTRKPEEAAAFAAKHDGWAFFLAPNTVAEVLRVAVGGDVMPPKSTYFYPKIPSGLVSHSLSGSL